MSDQIIICPHCKKEIPLNEALAHKLRKEIESDLKGIYEKKNEEDREKMRQYIGKKISEEKVRIEKEAFEKTEIKVRQEIELKMKDQENEAKELAEQNNNLQKQILEMTKLLRQLKNERENEKLELEKKLLSEEEKIRLDAKEKAIEENHLKILEKEKQLSDALKMNEELKRKLEQGSQQTQGEVLEMEIENILQTEFPHDEIKEVVKGVRGADVIQIVHDTNGRPVGTILWESKQTKNWTEGWISKLKTDQRDTKAELIVLVTEALPEGIKTFGLKNGVWITKRSFIIGLASALRGTLIWVFRTKLSTIGKNEKMESLFSYINSSEFSQRIEAIIDSFKGLQDDMEKEKRWFNLKWAKQEKNIRTVIDQTYGLHGDLQGIVGSLPTVKNMELPEGEKENNSLTEPSSQESIFKA